ncbi:MAG: hypothetical protein HUK08_08465, partial [Bacteroidaceae bacterium]|nr:hypothetical protein [Bacteroidaceae bacterium]
MNRLFLPLVLAFLLANTAKALTTPRTEGEIFADAQWIGGGGEDMTLYAQYLTTFRL